MFSFGRVAMAMVYLDSHRNPKTLSAKVLLILTKRKESVEVYGFYAKSTLKTPQYPHQQSHIH